MPLLDEWTLLCTKNTTDISSRKILTYIFILGAIDLILFERRTANISRKVTLFQL